MLQTRAKRERERERESSSRLSKIFSSSPSTYEGQSVISPSLAGGLNTISSPSLAEGARGWIDTTSALQAKSATANTKDTHPQTPLVLREGAFNQHNTPTPRKLALSLATASIIVGASIELATAACVAKRNSDGSTYYDCTGSMSAAELLAATNNKNALINLGRGEGDPLNVGAGSVSISNSGLTIFRGVNAANTDFNITGSGSAGVLLPYTLGNHQTNASTLRNLTLNGTLDNTSWGSQEVYRQYLDVDIHAGTQILGTLTNNATLTHAMAIYGGYEGTDRSTNVNKLVNNGTIPTLYLGYHQFAGDFASILGSYKIDGSGTINTLNVYQATLSIDANALTDSTGWNAHTYTNNDGKQHISASNLTVGTVGQAAIRINIGEGVTDANSKFLYKNLILNSAGGAGTGKIGYSNLRAGLGTAIKDAGDGQHFMLEADVATSYGSSMWRTLSLSYARRNIMVQNIIDTMTTKTFHSDRYYNQEVELRLLQYDMSRLTNRSSKFAKQTRKNQAKVDKMRDKLAKLTLEQSKGQNLDKGYNNFELIDQLDAIFIPYTGRRDWRVFFVPYAAHSYADMGASTATEWAGGAIGGVQRNLKGQGILSTYLTYEYAHATTEMLGANTTMQTNALQGGVSYFKIFPITGKVWEATLKASGRVGVDMPLLSAQSPLPNIKFNLASDKKGLITPLMWSLGAEVRGGLTFYQFKQNSYVSPEVGLSYDVLSPLDMKLEKAKYGLGGNEYYPSQYWHLPQLSGSVKYYKVYGNMFRTNFVAGLRYNMLNTPTAKFKIGGLAGEGKIILPAVYGYLDLDLIWVVKKNHELSAGYNGVFYANKFGKDVMDKFNGVSTSINFKYAHWFGGTDYVKDADGNAISRSVAEGKSKKSKKSKSKKSKKSKKKVYYIDG